MFLISTTISSNECVINNPSIRWCLNHQYAVYIRYIHVVNNTLLSHAIKHFHYAVDLIIWIVTIKVAQNRHLASFMWNYLISWNPQRIISYQYILIDISSPNEKYEIKSKHCLLNWPDFHLPSDIGTLHAGSSRCF